MNEIQTIQEFLRQVFTENCSCFEKTCEISFPPSSLVAHMLKMFRILRNGKTCVTFFEKKRRDHAEIIKKHITAFVFLGLLRRNTVDGKYYTFDNQPLTWSNLKSQHHKRNIKCACEPLQKMREDLVGMYKKVYKKTCEEGNVNFDCPDAELIGENDIHNFTIAMFWYFRKAIVDNLVQHVYTTVTRKTRIRDEMWDFDSKISGHSCHALSVGSVNITSDYDISLYGTCVTPVLRGFHKNFLRIFSEKSSEVFDTNIYGSSFIEMPNDIASEDKMFYKVANCSPNPEYDSEIYFYVDDYGLNNATKIKAYRQQNIWALLKLKINVNYCVNKYPDDDKINGVYRNLQGLPFLGNLNRYLSKTLDVNIDVTHRKQSNPGQSFCEYNESLNETYAALQILHDNYMRLVPKQHKGGALKTSKSFGNISAKYKYAQKDRKMGNLRSSISQENIIDDGSNGKYNNNDNDDYNLSIRFPEYNELMFNRVQETEKYTDLLNTISMFNFYGTETYFTRGAFLHVVFIMQTCATLKNSLKLDNSALFDSFTENYADFLSHRKTKYLKRMLSALNSMNFDSRDAKYLVNYLISLNVLDDINTLLKEPTQLNHFYVILENGFRVIQKYVCENLLNDDLFHNVNEIYQRTTILRI